MLNHFSDISLIDPQQLNLLDIILEGDLYTPCSSVGMPLGKGSGFPICSLSSFSMSSLLNPARLNIAAVFFDLSEKVSFSLVTISLIAVINTPF